MAKGKWKCFQIARIDFCLYVLMSLKLQRLTQKSYNGKPGKSQMVCVCIISEKLVKFDIVSVRARAESPE